MRWPCSAPRAPFANGTQLRVTRNLITQRVLADQRPNQKILSAVAGGLCPKTKLGRRRSRTRRQDAWQPRDGTEPAKGDPVDLGLCTVEAGILSGMSRIEVEFGEQWTNLIRQAL